MLYISWFNDLTLADRIMLQIVITSYVYRLILHLCLKASSFMYPLNANSAVLMFWKFYNWRVLSFSILEIKLFSQCAGRQFSLCHSQFLTSPEQRHWYPLFQTIFLRMFVKQKPWKLDTLSPSKEFNQYVNRKKIILI